MPNPSIALSGTPINTAQVLNDYNDRQMRNEMATQQILQQQYQNMDAREKSRIQSVTSAAAQLKPFLDNQDVNGALNFLMNRRQQLLQRANNGENVDTQETDYAIQELMSNDPKRFTSLRNQTYGLLAAGQVYGLDTGANRSQNPYIEQFQAVKSAHPDWTDAQVQDYVYTRGQVGKGTVFDQSGMVINQPGAVSAAAELAGAENFAKNLGGEAGKISIKNEETLGNLSNLQQAIDAANKSIPKVAMTGPLFGRVGALAKETNYINLQRDLNEITLMAKDLYNLGSGQGFTDADREFLKELAGGSYNNAESIQYALNRFQDAIKNRSQLLQQRNTGYQQQFGAGANQPVQSGGQGQQDGYVTVYNHQTQQALRIPASRLQEAERDGWTRN